MFDADRPIIKAEQDRLNRVVFAKYLARCMLDHKSPDSLVVGLYGNSGTGKTSLINLVVEELNFALTNLEDPEKPVILNFSPWSYSGQKKLVYHFFRRLASALYNAPYLENRDEVIRLLELYVSFFTQQPPVFRKKPWWKFYRGTDPLAWESGRDLTVVKSELNNLLSNQKHKIIILIDNISRLQGSEINQIFQIIKSMGDYANTVYLVALEKHQVITAIDRLQGSGGIELLEKMVQLPFEVPPIQQQDLETIFTDKISEIVKCVPEESWQADSWADIYYNSVRFLFKNCRDITRYVNVLSFGYYRLRDVVNPVDFFALTAIEVFAPEIYAGIRDNKDLFTDLLDRVYEPVKEELQKEKLRCEEILSRPSPVSQEIMLALLIRLFPRIRKIYYPRDHFYYSDASASKLKRICSPDVFDIYFRLSMQSGKIPAAEFNTLLSLAETRAVFDQALMRLTKDERITQFLDLLDNQAVLTKIPKNQIENIISALLDNGDLFPQMATNSLSLAAPMRIHRIIHALLQRITNSEDRFLILQNAIANAMNSIYIIIHELQQQEREQQEEALTWQPAEFRDLSEEQILSLKKLAVTRIEYWAKRNDLQDHPQLMLILLAWQEWCGNDDCKTYVSNATKTDRGLIAFLCAALQIPILQAMTVYEISPAWEKYLEDIHAVISPQSLVEHATILFQDEYFVKLREKEQLAIIIFLDLMKVKTKKTIRSTNSDSRNSLF